MALAVDRCLLMSDDQPFLVPVAVDDASDTDGRVPPRFRELQWTRLPGGETPPAFAQRVGELLAHATGNSPSPAAARVAPKTTKVDSPAGSSAAAATVKATSPEPSISSVAVLPFVNRSRDTEDEFFLPRPRR